MVGIAFDVDNLRNRVLCLIAQRVNDHAATNRAIWTSAARFAGPRNFECVRLGVNGSEIKAERGAGGPAEGRALEKSPARDFHFICGPRHCACQNYGGTSSDATTASSFT